MIWASGVSIFLALFILTLMAWPGRRVSRSRLGIDRTRPNLGKSIEGMLGGDRQRKLAQALNLADIDIEPGQLVLRVLVGSILLGILGLLFSPVMGLVFLVVPYFAARLLVARKGHKRQARFAEQLPEFIQSLTMALRSGFGLSHAITTALDEAEDPIKTEFDRVLAEVRMGRDLSEALSSLSQRMDNQDLDWVVGALDINRETGGNLSEILGTINSTIRERQRLWRKAETFTAEGRLSARTLTATPVLLGIWQWRVHPDGALWSGLGLLVLAGCAGLVAIGWLWIRKIITVKF